MASRYRMQIVEIDTNHVVAQWPPGLMQEKDLVQGICDRVALKGVGVGRTQAHVLSDVREAIRELFIDMKRMI